MPWDSGPKKKIPKPPAGSARHRADEDRGEGVGRPAAGHQGDVLFHKHRFDVFTNENVSTVLDVLAPDDIVLYGVATDVCDKAAVEGCSSAVPIRGCSWSPTR